MWPKRQQARKQVAACGGRTHPGVAQEFAILNNHLLLPQINKQTYHLRTAWDTPPLHGTAQRLRHAAHSRWSHFVDEDLNRESIQRLNHC